MNNELEKSLFRIQISKVSSDNRIKGWETTHVIICQKAGKKQNGYNPATRKRISIKDLRQTGEISTFNPQEMSQ